MTDDTKAILQAISELSIDLKKVHDSMDRLETKLSSRLDFHLSRISKIEEEVELLKRGIS